MVCKWIHDQKIGWWHLPDCWGAVTAGPDGCYCEPEPDSIEGRLARLESMVASLAVSESTDRSSINVPNQENQPS